MFFFSIFRLCCDILKGVTSQRNMPRRKGQGISPTKSKYILNRCSEIFQRDSELVCSICPLYGLAVERREILPFQEGRVKNTSLGGKGEKGGGKTVGEPLVECVTLPAVPLSPRGSPCVYVYLSFFNRAIRPSSRFSTCVLGCGRRELMVCSYNSLRNF